MADKTPTKPATSSEQSPSRPRVNPVTLGLLTDNAYAPSAQPPSDCHALEAPRPVARNGAASFYDNSSCEEVNDQTAATRTPLPSRPVAAYPSPRTNDRITPRTTPRRQVLNTIPILQKSELPGGVQHAVSDRMPTDLTSIDSSTAITGIDPRTPGPAREQLDASRFYVSPLAHAPAQNAFGTPDRPARNPNGDYAPTSTEPRTEEDGSGGSENSTEDLGEPGPAVETEGIQAGDNSNIEKRSASGSPEGDKHRLKIRKPLLVSDPSQSDKE